MARRMLTALAGVVLPSVRLRREVAEYKLWLERAADLLARHEAYLTELGEMAQVWHTPGWDYERGEWSELRTTDGVLVPVP